MFYIYYLFDNSLFGFPFYLSLTHSAHVLDLSDWSSTFLIFSTFFSLSLWLILFLRYPLLLGFKYMNQIFNFHF